MNEPRELRPNAVLRILFATVISIFSLPLLAAGVIAPNETLVLKAPMDGTAPDGTFDSCDKFGGVAPICEKGFNANRLGANTSAGLAFSRATAMISSYYDFAIDAGTEDFDNVLNAQIAGRGEFNGFLALIAGGEVSAKLNMKLYDLGETDAATPAEPRLVHQDSLSSHELAGKVTTGIGFSITVEGGAPYIGVGGSPSLGFNIQLQKKLVRDGVDFGFGALVRRGHSYRVVFEVQSQAKRFATNGVSVSQFQLSEPVLKILSPSNWRGSLTSTIDAKLPVLKPQSMRIKEGLDWLVSKRMQETEYFDSVADEFKPLTSTSTIIDRLVPADFPKSFADIIDNRFNVSSEIEETISDPGFSLHELTVTLEADVVAILDDQTKRINEIMRLLLLPQGQRSTDMIDCDSPGNSGSNGNNNGNGNGNGNGNANCSFPASGSNSPSNGTASSGSSGGTPDNLSTMTADARGGSAGGGAIGLATLLAGLGLLVLRMRQGT